MKQESILFVTAYFGEPHGTAKSARDFLRALLASSRKVNVISPKREKMPGKLCGHPLSTPVWLKPPLGTRLPLLRNWWLDQKQKRLQRCLGGARLAVVNGWASLDYWKHFERGVTGTKAIIVRESPRHFSEHWYNVELSEVVKDVSNFDVLWFVSERCQKEWLSFPELQCKPSFYVPNCCEEEETEILLREKKAAVRERLGLPSDEFVVVCPGAIERRKGQDLLLNILPKLNAAVPKLRLLFIGDPRTEWGCEFTKSLARHPLASRLTHWPSRPGILDALYAADALAFPSRAEALPRTILEAMALKTPLVACSVDGVVELVENRKTGILIETEDCAGLLAGLLTLSRNRALSSNLAEAGYARYWNVFSRRHQFDRVRKSMEAISGNFAPATSTGGRLLQGAPRAMIQTN